MSSETVGEGRGEELDWSVEGRAGIKLAFDGDEFAIAQVLENGFAITWTTPDSASEAVEKCVVTDDPEMVATVRFDGDQRTTLRGNAIRPFLASHDCWWVKLRLGRLDDYVVFAAGEEGKPNELATLGPPIEGSVAIQDEERTHRRIVHLTSMMEETATLTLRASLNETLPRLVATVKV